MLILHIALWVVAGVLALLYVFAGITKTFTPKENLRDKMPYTEDLTVWQLKAVGIVEFFGALGLVLPELLDVAPVLTPIAAFGLVLVQVVAIIIHVRRNEQKALPFNAVLLLAALFVGVGRLFV
jgi:uncharacterized membrane protein YphA (DoxX/SURF4 family)